MKLMTIIFISAMSTLPAYADLKEAWRPISDPTIMSLRFKTHFDSLPLEGRAGGKSKFWSGDYWPLNMGNINYRWNAKKKEGFDLKSPSRQNVLKMSQAELAALSPSEKLDILNADYDYSLRKEVEGLSYKEAQDWEGICHGWAPASMNHNEPEAKILENADGVKVPFGSADIKALISFYYANYHQVENTFQMGVRCFRAGHHNRNTYCKSDLNAGAFHIVLANKIGIQKTGFLADLERFREVWNHPVHSYKSKIITEKRPGDKAARGTVKVLVVKSDVEYISESNNFWETIIGTKEQIVEVKKYQYELDLDKDGKIIGGDWISSERPDFLWLMSKPAKFLPPFKRLKDLLND